MDSVDNYQFGFGILGDQSNQRAIRWTGFALGPFDERSGKEEDLSRSFEML